MKDITFQFDKPIPKECVGKTLKEVFDICCSKSKEINLKLKDCKSPEAIQEKLTADDRTYLEMISMFKELASGEGELKIVSPYL